MRTSLDWMIPERLVDLVDFAFRPICLVCRAPVSRRSSRYAEELRGLLCRRCSEKIVGIPEPTCFRCGSPSTEEKDPHCRICDGLPPGFDRMRSATMMGGVSETLVHRFKYQGWKDLVDFMVMKILSSPWSDREFWNADLLVPVPISRVRLRERGYNQSLLLAEGISGKVGIPFNNGALERVEWRRPQVGLSYRERLKNVRNAFSVPARARDSIAGKRIILVDDVVTTGATVAACYRALEEVGAKQVSCVSFGRVDYGNVSEPLSI